LDFSSGNDSCKLQHKALGFKIFAKVAFMELFSVDLLSSFLTLTALELVLGLDNLIFISILASKLPVEQREKARKMGLLGALATRLVLLSLMSYLASLTQPLFEVNSFSFSGKSLILIGGGLFLLYKATKEIHHKLEESDTEDAGGTNATAKIKFSGVIIQIMLLDLVFSIDSVITAVGMTTNLPVMVAANVVALGAMLTIGKPLGAFVEKHPSIKVLALSFLMMVALVLLGEGFGLHIPKGYVYTAMAFSVFVEILNIKTSKKKLPKTA
jgi:predicted tellurium resistance membrane protein TerC